MNGEHISCDWDYLFYDDILPDFLEDDEIVLVSVSGDQWNNFLESEDEEAAYEYLEYLNFNFIESIEYGEWEKFYKIITNTVDEKEADKLKQDFSAGGHFDNVSSAVLLYYTEANGKQTFVTSYTD
tara:strand:+ start:122 stop:499 length:378 start_codon:yes stop_codon:yes gene_type:complete